MIWFQALEEALQEKADIEAQIERNSLQEAQLLDDFEWKLGEIERDYKKKIADAEKRTEERVRSEMAAELQKLIDDRKDVDDQLNEVNTGYLFYYPTPLLTSCILFQYCKEHKCESRNI